MAALKYSVFMDSPFKTGFFNVKNQFAILMFMALLTNQISVSLPQMEKITLSNLMNFRFPKKSIKTS